MRGGPLVKHNPKAPPPINIKYEDIYITRALEYREIMEGMKIPEKGGLQCVDKSILDRQKGLMAEVVK